MLSKILEALEHAHGDVQKQAAWVIAALSLGNCHIHEKIAEKGGFKALRSCLSSPNDDAKAKVLSAIVNFSTQDSLVERLITSLLPPLLQILSDAPDELRLLALQSIQNIALAESVCKQVNQYDLRRVLQLLSSSPDHRIQEYAIRCVINLAAYPTLRKQLVQEDAKTILAPFLKSSNSTIRTHAEHAQRNLSV